MKLVIVESPAKCKTIKRYLGNDYEVLASFGHVCSLPSANGSVEPENDFKMHYTVNKDSDKHIKNISKIAKKSDVIYLATDPDREGEAISWHVLETLKSKKIINNNTSVYRISFNEITKKAVQTAIQDPRDIDMNLVDAQQARSALDYLFGFNLSPVLWRKLPGSKSAGRVQSVALRLICERENEIKLFESKEYWSIKIAFLNNNKDIIEATLVYFNNEKLEQFSIINENQANQVIDSLKEKQYHVNDISKKDVQRKPKPPFNTSSLQQEASRKLGFGVKRTMSVAQQLYEGVESESGLITYMRTDAISMSQEAISNVRNMIKSKFGNEFLPASPNNFNKKAKNAQEAHEAIRPTDFNITPDSLKGKLSKDQYALYELIWKRTVASQMSNAIISQVTIEINSSNNDTKLRATGSTIKFAGFYSLYIEGTDDEVKKEKTILPHVSVNEELAVNKINPNQHFTQAPPRFTEASLVKKMEELGIGRPSTYATVISVIQDRQYVKIESKRFIPEERGSIVSCFLSSFFHRYIEYDFTANLEEKLDMISANKVNWKIVLSEFWKEFIENINQIKEKDILEIIEVLDQQLEKFIFTKNEDGSYDRKCPKCTDGTLSLKLGKFGAFKGCSNYPECNYIKSINNQESDKEDNQEVTQDIVIGNDPETNLEIKLKKGPYGPYLQLGEKEKNNKPKRAPVLKGYDVSSISLELALKMLSLPRILGNHPDDNKEISVGVGRYGPYIKYNSKFISIKTGDDILEITLDKALEIISTNNSKTTKSSKEPVKSLGVYQDNEINIYDGRYGAYFKFNKKNIKIPTDYNIEDISLNDIENILKKKK